MMLSLPIAVFLPSVALGLPALESLGVGPGNLRFTSVPVFMNLKYLDPDCGELTNLTVCVPFFEDKRTFSCYVDY